MKAESVSATGKDGERRLSWLLDVEGWQVERYLSMSKDVASSLPGRFGCNLGLLRLVEDVVQLAGSGPVSDG